MSTGPMGTRFLEDTGRNRNLGAEIRYKVFNHPTPISSFMGENKELLLEDSV